MSSIDDAINRVTDKEPFYTALIRALEPVSEPDIPTLGTDGTHLFYNAEFFDSHTPDEQSALILHETLHCAFSHMWRVGKKDKMKWNIATDYAINPMVDEVFKLPEGALIDSKYYGMSAEQIYKVLPKNKNKQQTWCEKDHWDEDDKGNKKGKGQGSGQEDSKKKGKGAGSDSEGKGKPGKDKGNGSGDWIEKIKDAMGNGKKARLAKKQEEWRKELKKASTQSKWKRIFQKTFLDDYGNAPDSAKRVIEKDFYIPALDWASIVASILSEDTTDYSFNQPDRRYMGADFVIPGMFSYDNLKDVVFAYDTSGSITDDDLKAFYGETQALFENFSNLTGWGAVCDAYLHHFGELSAKAPFNRNYFIGGGGTDFNPVFDEIKNRNMKIKALFFFTDTYGSFPREEPPYPVFWLVRSHIGDNSEINVPFGRVIKFMAKK